MIRESDRDMGFGRGYDEYPRQPPAPGRRTLTAGLVSRMPRGPAASAATAAPVSLDGPPPLYADLCGGDSLEVAAQSAGAPLPSELGGALGSALGVDLSAVSVHTGAPSSAAAAAIDARAYASGQQIHFGAGEYDPGSVAGRHLIAHEVAHTVQQRGASTVAAKRTISQAGDAAEVEADSFADAFVSGQRPAPVLGRATGTLHRTPRGSGGPQVIAADTRPDDMDPVNWDQRAAAAGAFRGEPRPIDLGLAATPPRLVAPHIDLPPPPAAGPFAPIDPPPVATITEMSPEYRLRWELERRQAWEAYRADSNTVEVAWNSASPEVLAYQRAERDGSLAAVAGDLFQGNEVELSASEERGLRTASGRPAVSVAMQETHALDHDVDAARSGVQRAAHSVNGRLEALLAAWNGVQLRGAQREARAAASEVAALRAERDEVATNIDTLISVVGIIGSIGLGMTTVAAAVGDAAGDQAGEVGGMIGDQIYGASIARANERLRQANAAVESLLDQQQMHALRAAFSEYQASGADLAAARSTLQAAMIRRRARYDALGHRTATASGLSGNPARRVEAVIRAVPRVEVVVAQSAAILAAIGEPGHPRYREQSGVGFAMAEHDHLASQTASFVQSLAGIRHWRARFGTERDSWTARLDSLRRQAAGLRSE
jgi:uncharacterized protein DUF4157